MEPRFHPVTVAVRQAVMEMRRKHINQISQDEVLEPETKSRFSFLRFWTWIFHS